MRIRNKIKGWIHHFHIIDVEVLMSVERIDAELPVSFEVEIEPASDIRNLCIAPLLVEFTELSLVVVARPQKSLNKI